MKLLLLPFCLLLCFPLPEHPASQENPPDSEVDPEERVRAVAVSPDGKWIAAGYSGGRVALLGAENGQHLRDLEPALPDDAWRLDFSPDGERLAGLGHDGKLMLWELHSVEGVVIPRVAETPEAVPPNHEWRDYCFGSTMLWSPDGERLAIGDWFGNNSLWTATGELVQRWTVSNPPGDPQLVWNSDGGWLITVDGRNVRVREAGTGAVISDEGTVGKVECPDEIVALAVHEGGELVATGHTGCWLRLWDLKTGNLEGEVQFPEAFSPFGDVEVAAIAFSPRGGRLALSTRQGTYVIVIDVESRERIWTSEYHGAHFFEVMQLCWSPDGSRLWYSFECGGGELFHVEPKDGAEPVALERSNIPRFGGSTGVLDTCDGIRVVRFDGERVW